MTSRGQRRNKTGVKNSIFDIMSAFAKLMMSGGKPPTPPPKPVKEKKAGRPKKEEASPEDVPESGHDTLVNKEAENATNTVMEVDGTDPSAVGAFIPAPEPEPEEEFEVEAVLDTK